MADETITDTTAEDTQPILPAEVANFIAEEEFDVSDWLGGTKYPQRDLEIYNDGDLLDEIQELTNELVAFEADKKERERQLLKPKSIGDPDEGAILDGVRARVADLRNQLKGTGKVFAVRGVAPGERKVLSQTIARTFKPKNAVVETDLETQEKTIVEPAIEGGENHPEFNKAFEHALVAKTIVAINGKAIKFTPEQIVEMEDRLPGVEYQRLANECYEVNFLNYSIEQLVTADFS